MRACAGRCVRRRRVRTWNCRAVVLPRCLTDSCLNAILAVASFISIPTDLLIHVSVRSVKSLAKPAAGAASSATASASASAASASASAFKIKIFYGSQSGTAEGFARQLKKEAVRYGVAAVVQDLETYTPVS